MNPPLLTTRSALFHYTIAAFIEARRDAKLKGKEDDAEAASKYDYATWLADAARRVHQIRAVTHVLKATHPDASGNDLDVTPAALPQRAEIGSHLLGGQYTRDVVGNAAALDVWKLLKLEVEGKRLLDWMQAGDAELKAALSDDAERAQEWMRAFASLVREDAQLTTHPMAKQIYWLTGDTPTDDHHYHLLQPMFASSLAHVVHTDIEDARFGDTNKTARQAKRDNKPAVLHYRDYRNLAIRKLGGTKPQNVSQLNSERGGVNYLLSSLPPPAWKSPESVNLRKADSMFADQHSAFLFYGEVRSLLRELADFLKNDPDPNVDTRNRVGALLQKIADELASFGAEIRGRQQPGWTRDHACQLPRCEQLWLDPERSEMPLRDDPEHPHWREDDIAFNAAYEHGDWADQVATRFGRWLNHQLRKRSDKLAALGEAEMRHFASKAVLDVAWPIPRQRRARGGAA